MTWDPQKNINPDFAADVWGRPVSVHPYSLFWDLFTYGPSVEKWRSETPTDSAFTTKDGSLFLDSGTAAQVATLQSRRHPRYQPNRGHHYATAWQRLPSLGKVRWGLGTSRYAVYFEWDGDEGKLYACRTNSTGATVPSPEDHLDGGATVTDTEREEVTLPPHITDLKINHLADIRFQWRGSGDVLFYVDEVLVYRMERLNKEQGISFAVPSLPCFYEIENTGTGQATAEFGCVDVSAEGGLDPKPETATRVIPGTKAAVSTTEVPVLAVRAGDFLAGIEAMRDGWLIKATGQLDSDGTFKIYRNPTSVTVSAWTLLSTVSGKSVLEYATGTAVSAFTATAIQLIGEIVIETATSTKGETSFLPDGQRELISSGGADFPTDSDVFLITATKKVAGSAAASATLIVGEET